MLGISYLITFFLNVRPMKWVISRLPPVWILGDFYQTTGSPGTRDSVQNIPPQISSNANPKILGKRVVIGLPLIFHVISMEEMGNLAEFVKHFFGCSFTTFITCKQRKIKISYLFGDSLRMQMFMAFDQFLVWQRHAPPIPWPQYYSEMPHSVSPFHPSKLLRFQGEAGSSVHVASSFPRNSTTMYVFLPAAHMRALAA